jgi:hypothetical protein
MICKAFGRPAAQKFPRKGRFDGFHVGNIVIDSRCPDSANDIVANMLLRQPGRCLPSDHWYILNPLFSGKHNFSRTYLILSKNCIWLYDHSKQSQIDLRYLRFEIIMSESEKYDVLEKIGK